MGKGLVQVYYGDGRGKTMAALGTALRAAGNGRTVVVVQFLKGKADGGMEFLKRLEPEIKIFCFEKSEGYYEELSENEKNEAKMNMVNGLNYAKKVLLTGECNVLVLDEVLGMVDTGIISSEDLEAIIEAKTDDTDIILTGRVLEDSVRAYADEVLKIVAEK